MNIEISKIDADLSLLRQERADAIRESIKDVGLLHPVIVCENGDRYTLAAGKARLKAYQDLNLESIPATLVTAEDAARIKEISLQENLRRHNLEWYEVIELEEELHNLRTEQHGKKRTGRNASSSPGWSQTDTATELGIALGAMSQDLFLANALKRNPHLKKVKDKQTALKLAKEASRREFQESSALMPVSFEMNQILCGDSSELLKEIPSETFNLCLTDPPWLEFRDDSLTRDESTLPVFREVFRVLQRDSLLYAFVSTQDFYFYSTKLREFGFAVQDYPMIWHKTGMMSYGRRSWESARDFELILVAAKGNPVLIHGVEMTSVLKYSAVPSIKLTHPNEKPLDLLIELLRRSTFDESKILDPFAGSGSTLIAAKTLKRPFVGIERNHKFCEKIQKRIESWDISSQSLASPSSAS